MFIREMYHTIATALERLRGEKNSLYCSWYVASAGQ